MTYGYVRVSTDKQEYENQKFAILEYANKNKLGNVAFVMETISSRKKLEDRDLSNLLNNLQKGDVLVVSELSRLGRSIIEIMSIFKTLVEKQVETHIIKGGFVIGSENKIQNSVLIFAFGLSAEIERELISKRTKEALAQRKAKGIKLGRKKGAKVRSKLDPKRKQIIELLDKGVNITNIAKILGCSRTTLTHYIKTRVKVAKNEEFNKD